MDTFIKSKLFRFRENEKKIWFIMQHGIPFDTIRKACAYSIQNNFHSFGHELGVAEQAIKIALTENRNTDEVKVLGLIGLFHDAWHIGEQHIDDEMRAFELAKSAITQQDIQDFSRNHDKIISTIRDWILATIFGQRGNRKAGLEKIIQDADLGHLWLGREYQLRSSMGLIDEWNAGFQKAWKPVISPEHFVRTDQEKFIQFLWTIDGVKNGVRLSDGAAKIYKNPFDYIDTLKSLPVEAIEYAYSVRHDDILFEDFKNKISTFSQKSSD